MFDASQAQPSSVNWSWRLSTRYASGLSVSLVIRGTAARRFRILSAAGGGNGYFNDVNGMVPGSGQIDAEYCDFIRIGDASHAFDYVALEYRTGTMRFDHCVFWGCGIIGGVIAASRPCPSPTVSRRRRPVRSPSSAIWAAGVATLSDCDLDGQGSLGFDTSSFRTACTGNTYRAWHYESGVWTGPSPPGPYPATCLTFTGPSSAVVGQATAAFTVALAGGTTVPARSRSRRRMAARGGMFTPASVPLTTDTPVRHDSPIRRARRVLSGSTSRMTGPSRGETARCWYWTPITIAATQPATAYLAIGPDPDSGVAGGGLGAVHDRAAAVPNEVRGGHGHAVGRRRGRDFHAGLGAALDSQPFGHVHLHSDRHRAADHPDDERRQPGRPRSDRLHRHPRRDILQPDRSQRGRMLRGECVHGGPAARHRAGRARHPRACRLDGDGTFQPASIVLSNACRSASFTYTPS